MPTVMTHPAVPLGLGMALGSKTVPSTLLLAGVVGSVVPDLDAIGFWLGVPYGSPFGHRGFTHSILFAAAMGVIASAFAGRFLVGSLCAFLFVFLSTVSHGILDALTNGGMGIAFLGPLTNDRYFLPWRILEVSPIGIHAGPRGFAIAWSELRYVWLPCMGVGLIGFSLRKRGAQQPA